MSPRTTTYDDEAAQIAAGALGDDATLGAGFRRLVAVVARLRRDCPWDAEQTQLTLVKHLVEEAAEAIEAIESGDDADQCEELGDLLLQVCFHAEIARQQGRFDIEDVTAAVAKKLLARHPYVFGSEAAPADMMASWEEAKRAEKQRSSCLDGIPDAMNSLARAAKVITRVRDVHLELPLVSDTAAAPETPDSDASITAAKVGQTILAVVAQAQAAGVDADQALRGALRGLEQQIRAAEGRLVG
ncbi:MAG: nucleoside triphosphate pyrophosphohydrolase [Propionibacteriaceae bacterium]|jgi:XTP/dITP diphosphohydrolase|nr:nucleoside triphosphate pyrophosphohydrolase [Propionibacteriaceae bacterium]